MAYICKLCKNPVTVTLDPVRRYTLPRYIVECATCGPRRVGSVPPPVANRRDEV